MIQEATAELSTPESELTSQGKKARREKLAGIEAKAKQELARKPDDVGANHSMSRLAMRLGNTEAAAAYAEKALSLAQSRKAPPAVTSQLLVTRGLARYEAGDYEAANRDAQEALRLDPDNRGAFELYMYTLGRGEGGTLAGPKAPGKTKPLSWDGEALSGLSERELVERILALQTPGMPRTGVEWAVRQDKNPTPAGKLALEAIRSRKQGDLTAAMSHAEAAVKTDPADPMGYFQRGRLKKDKGDYSGAIVDLTRAMALGWNEGLLFSLRAQALMKAGKFKAALLDLDMAVSLEGRDAGYYFLRALAKRKLGRPLAEAAEDLKLAAKLDPKRYQPHYEAILKELGKG